MDERGHWPGRCPHASREWASQLGYVRSYTDDLMVYRRLVEAGARVVYDTRSCAAAKPEDFAELRPLLDGMLELTGRSLPPDDGAIPPTQATEKSDSAGVKDSGPAKETARDRPRVLREIYLSPSLTEGGIAKYSPVSASNPLNRFPHALPAARVRLYPLAYVDSFGNCESAPLAIARRF